MESSPNTVELFNLDRGVYPSYLWRYYPYWKKQIEHRRDPTVIIPQLDSIYELFRNKIGSLDAVSTLAVCLFGNVAAGRHMVAYNIASCLARYSKEKGEIFLLPSYHPYSAKALPYYAFGPLSIKTTPYFSLHRRSIGFLSSYSQQAHRLS